GRGFALVRVRRRREHPPSWRFAPMWEPDRGRLGRRFGWRRRGRAPVRAAVAAAALGGVVGGATIAADRSLRAALEQLPVAQRSFTATWLGTLPAGGYQRVDRAATNALRRL